jgi:hypothetical protein
MKLPLFSLLISAIALVPGSAQVVVQWNFNGNAATTVPGGTASPMPSFKSPQVPTAVASLIGGTTATFASGVAGVGSSDPVKTSPPNFGWNTTTYAAQGTGNLERGVQFAADLSAFGPGDLQVESTSIYTGLLLSFDVRRSNTASRFLQLLYTLNGSDWIAPAAGLYAGAGDTWTNGLSLLLGPEALTRSFAFRIVAAFDPNLEVGAYSEANPSSTYATTGTVRYDMVTLQVIPEPATYAGLFGGAVLLVVLVRRFRQRRQNGPN